LIESLRQRVEVMLRVVARVHWAHGVPRAYPAFRA
jgi:hypothetical protein